MTTFDDIRARLELRQVVEQYARGADTRDAVLFADAFTEDGVLHTTRGDISGRADLLKVAPRLGRYKATMHLVGNHYVTFGEPDRASGVTYCEASHMREVEGVDWVYVMRIVYHDVYAHATDGWRISERRLELLWEEDRPLKAG